MDALRARLDGRNWQRVHAALIVALSAGAAFLVSFTLLRLHLSSMAWRYGMAAVAGYGVFLLLIRAWVLWKSWRLGDSDVGPAPVARVSERSHGGVGIDLGDIDISVPSRGSGRATQVAIDAFRGGQSGGGGASMVFEPPPPGAPPVSAANVSGGKGGFSLDLDGDDAFWLAVALVATCAGAIAVGYVIWMAPTFLGEATIHAAVAGKVYHGMLQRDSSHWTSDQITRTLLPAIVIVLTAILAGYAFHRAAPGAESIGDVVNYYRVYHTSGIPR